ncbi:MAG: HipA domain-containing protein [Oligoflexia bacterium]|nr:HipA domain-containing protein [Oligoflexia bacterium]
MNPKDINELTIYKQGKVAGSIIRTDKGCDFIYDDAYLASGNNRDLAFNIPKTQKRHSVSGINLHTYFAGLLPEGLRLKAIIEHLKTSPDDLFSILAASGSDCIGDVSACPPGDSKYEPEKYRLKDIDFYVLFNKSITDKYNVFHSEGIPGIQSKISGSMISFPLSMRGEEKGYILKLNPADKPSLVENEYWTLMLAEKCGIKTNRTKIIHDKNKNKGLLVERFDRVFDRKSNCVIKVHQEDACQFLDKYPSEKYRLSVNLICDGIKELASAPVIDILTLLKVYVFSYITGNGDMHAKNISLVALKDGKQVTLSPAYDLVTTLIYGDRTMALKIDGKDDGITKKMIVEFAMRYGINELPVLKMIDNLVMMTDKNYAVLFNVPMEEKKRADLERTIKSRLKQFG